MTTPTPSAARAGAAGVLSAYALGQWIALRSQLPLISAEAPTSWIHVAYTGSWEGHPNGAFEFTLATFKEIVANFERQHNPIPLDFDHETVFSDGPTPAKGWVHQLEIRKGDDGRHHLWALAEFGPQAVQFNREGGYRFNSGVFEFDSVDRVTGEECGCVLSSVALTDSPFVDGQAPLSLSTRRARASTTNEEHMTKDTIRALMAISKESLAAALDQIEGDEISPKQLEAAAQFAAAKDGDAEEEPAEAPMADAPDEEDEKPMADSADDEDEKPMGEQPAADTGAVPLADPDADAALAALAPLAEATGMDLTALAAALQENMDAVLEALTGALEEPAGEAPLDASESSANPPMAASDRPDAERVELGTIKTALGAVTKERDEMRAKLEEIEQRDAEAAVDTYVQAGVILDDAKADMVALYRTQRDAFNRIVASLKQVVPTGEHASAVQPAQAAHPEPTEEDEKDPEIVALRKMLSRAGVPLSKQNKAVSERLAARRETRA